MKVTCRKQQTPVRGKSVCPVFTRAYQKLFYPNYFRPNPKPSEVFFLVYLIFVKHRTSIVGLFLIITCAKLNFFLLKSFENKKVYFYLNMAFSVF